MKRRTEIEKLYAVADGDEADVLDRLREKAGITWECRDENGYSHWTNTSRRKTCERCHRPRQGRRKAA